MSVYHFINSFFLFRALKNCRKIGEGVYGEVYLWRARDGRARVLKIVPIAGHIKVNGEDQKDYHEIISEIVIAMWVLYFFYFEFFMLLCWEVEAVAAQWHNINMIVVGLIPTWGALFFFSKNTNDGVEFCHSIHKILKPSPLFI